MKVIQTLLLIGLVTVSSFAKESEPTNGWQRFWDAAYERFDLMPEYYIEANISSFAFFKNSYLKQKFLMENNTDLDIGLVSLNKKLFLFGHFKLQTLMGRNKGENVLFDPAEMNFGIIPTFEYRYKSLLFQTGLNHHCFHEIDQFELPTIYWNGAFLATGSQNMRLQVFREGLDMPENWLFPKRFSWYFNAMYYIKEFGDMVEPVNINSANERDTEFRLFLRYALYKSRYWLFLTESETVWGSWSDEALVGDNEGAYFLQRLGLHALLHKGKKGFRFFLDYHFDTVPEHTHMVRFSKDRMVEIGLEFFR